MFRDLFKDMIVVELASVLAGPSVSAFFAEWGAKVIKIENLNSGGDVTRHWKLSSEHSESDLSAYFSTVNFGKESLALDLKSDQGKQILYEIISKSDVVVASYKPGDAEKLGVDYQTLKQWNHQIIYGHITGYGLDSNRAGYDAIIQAETGYMSMNGEANGEPCKLPVALMDVLTAHQLKEALLMALWQKDRSGGGQYIAVSLYQSGLTGLVNQATNYLNVQHIPKPMGAEHPNIVPYGTVFTCRDGNQIILAIGTDKQCKILFELLDIAEEFDRFATNVLRVQNREEIRFLLKQKISRFTRENLLTLLHQKNIPAGALNRMDDVFSGNENQNILIQSEKNGKQWRTVRQSVFSVGKLNLSAPPHLGEHTTELLKSELNFSDKEIETLLEAGIVKSI